MKNLKMKLTSAKAKFDDNKEVIAYVSYLSACFAAGYLFTTKVIRSVEAQQRMVNEHELLRLGVAAGHDYKYEADTDTLWDVTVRPDKAA